MINYKFINDSIAWYEGSGFSRVEVPWTVTKEISDITKPKDAKDFQLVHDNGKVLVASAEQSFLYQYAKGFLPKGKFQAITPCFRKENFDSIHTKYFIKNELINTIDTSRNSLNLMVGEAFNFFQTYFGIGTGLEVVQTSGSSCDIVYKGDELGSYGIRSCDFLTWLYGTGVAEPRLSTIIKKHRL